MSNTRNKKVWQKGMKSNRNIVLLFLFIFFIWASSWENVSSGVSDQVRLKLACSATEASMRLEILVTETKDITLPRQWTTKVLIRLRRCSDWSVSLLFAYDIWHIFSWPGSFIFIPFLMHLVKNVSFETFNHIPVNVCIAIIFNITLKKIFILHLFLLQDDKSKSRTKNVNDHPYING